MKRDFENENPYRTPEDVGAAVRKKGLASLAFKILLAVGALGLVVIFLLPNVRFPREAARRNGCTNQMKQIAIALQTYAAFYHALPPAHTVDADGKPLHSWRTLILPFLEQRALYEKIDLTKPWDDPANAEARRTVVDAYECPSNLERGNRTTYLAVVGPDCALFPDRPRALAEITDGERETLMLVEVGMDHAVEWMSPVDANEDLVLGIGTDSQLAHAKGVNAVYVDGHVAFLPADTTDTVWRALLSIAGNDSAVLHGFWENK